MAMGEDKLLPGSFGKLSRHGTPWVAILVTSGFMLFIIIFLNLEILVKTASTLKLLMFTLANWSVIIMRESKLPHYRPKFRAPLYPWLQIVGIAGECFLISQMGRTPLLIVGSIIICALVWYWFYARGKTKRDNAFLYVLGRITGKKKSPSLLDDELKELGRKE